MHSGQCAGSLSPSPHSHQSSNWQKERQLSALLCLTSCTTVQCRKLQATRILQTWLLRKRLTSHTASLSQPSFQVIALFQLRKNRVDPLVRKANKQKRERESDSLFLRWWRTAGWAVSIWLPVTTDSAGDRWFAHIKIVRTRGRHWDSRAGLRLHGPVFVARVWNPGFSPQHCEETCAVTLRIGNNIYSSGGKAKIFQPILFLIPNKLVPPAMIIYIDF